MTILEKLVGRERYKAQTCRLTGWGIQKSFNFELGADYIFLGACWAAAGDHSRIFNQCLESLSKNNSYDPTRFVDQGFRLRMAGMYEEQEGIDYDRTQLICSELKRERNYFLCTHPCFSFKDTFESVLPKASGLVLMELLPMHVLGMMICTPIKINDRWYQLVEQ